MTMVLSACASVCATLFVQQYVNTASPPPAAGDSSSTKSWTGDGEEDEEVQEDLSDFQGSHEDCKLVLVVRTDLGMTKGPGGISATVLLY